MTTATAAAVASCDSVWGSGVFFHTLIPCILKAIHQHVLHAALSPSSGAPVVKVPPQAVAMNALCPESGMLAVAQQQGNSTAADIATTAVASRDPACSTRWFFSTPPVLTL